MAREFGLARKTIGKMLEYSLPPGYRRQKPVRRPKLGPWQGVIDAILEEVYQQVAQSSGIRFGFDREDRQNHVNSYTFYLGYQGPLPNPNTVKVDITIAETVLFPVEQKEILRAYEEFNDIPEGRAVAAYSLDEIAIEKVVALGDRARNEPRDLYDLWFLTSHAGVELRLLLPAIEEKLRFRNREITGLQDRIVAKEARLKALE